MRPSILTIGTLAVLLGVGALPLASDAWSAHAESKPSACVAVDVKRCFADLSTGIRMAYVEVGPPDVRTLILLHGLTDSARSWSLAMASLHSKDPTLRIIAIDQRGHGQSSVPPASDCAATPKACFTPGLFAADLLAFMDQHAIDRATVAGHLMGSMVAQEVALEHPGRIEAAVLVASSNRTAGNAVLNDYVLKEPVLGSWKAGLDAKGISDPAAVWSATPLDADPEAEAWIAANWDIDPAADPLLVSAIAKETAHVRLGTWRGATEALLEVDNTERLAGLKVPTLVLWGTQDSIFYNDPDQVGLIGALARASAGQGTKFVWKQYGVDPLPASGAQGSDIGHNVQWDAPNEVADDILSFMTNGEPTRDGYRAVIGNMSVNVVGEPGGAKVIPPSR